MKKTIRNLIFFNFIIILFGCESLPSFDDVLPDKRTTYKKSRDLPELEVPPDLTVTKGDYASEIPNDVESTSLNEFERQRSIKNSNDMILGSGNFEDEKWIALAGSAGKIWPKLKEFWDEIGYTFYLDDAELGVLETDWKEIDSIKQKFKILTEPSEDGGTILFLSSERQELSEGEWLDIQPDESAEKDIINKLSQHFDINLAPKRVTSEKNPASSITPDKESAIEITQILSTQEGVRYLEIALSFDLVWINTKQAIERAGYYYESSDKAKGIHVFRYLETGQDDEEKSLFSRLKFWGDDEEELLYTLSVRSAGEKTEIFLLKKDGDFEVGKNVSDIFKELQIFYNSLKE